MTQRGAADFINVFEQELKQGYVWLSRVRFVIICSDGQPIELDDGQHGQRVRRQYRRRDHFWLLWSSRHLLHVFETLNAYDYAAVML
jgi:hypothetical protein